MKVSLSKGGGNSEYQIKNRPPDPPPIKSRASIKEGAPADISAVKKAELDDLHQRIDDLEARLDQLRFEVLG